VNAKERLTAAIKGEKVDRQPVCFYEINGFTQDADDSNPFYFSAPQRLCARLVFYTGALS
jgi:hypothetical protein